MLALGLMSLVSAIGLWMFSRLAPRVGLVDQPNHRSLHEEPKVVGAGVVPVFLIAGYLFLSLRLVVTTVLCGCFWG